MRNGDRSWLRVIVGGATLLGVAVRLWGLEAHGAWFDEAYYVSLSEWGSPELIIGAVVATPPSAPLYPLILDAWTHVAGTGDATIRLPSVLFGALTVPAAAWLGMEATRDRLMACLAALLVAVSPMLVQMSQEARPYALAALTLTVALGAASRWSRTRTTSGVALHVAAAEMALYAHYLAAVPLAVVAVLRQRRPTFLAGHLAVIVLWVPWLVASAVASVQAPVLRTSFPADDPFARLAGTVGEGAAGHVALLAGWFPLMAAGAVVGCALLALGWRADPGLTVAAAATFLLPATASLLLDRWLFAAPFLALALPAVLVIAAAGVVRATLVSRALGVGLLAAWLSIQAAGLLIDRSGRWHEDDQYREIAALVNDHREPGEPMLVTPPILTPGLSHYGTSSLTGLPVAFDPARVYLPTQPAEWSGAMASALAALDRDDIPSVWVFYRADMDPGGGLLTGLRARYPVEERWTYDVADLYRFDRGDR